MFSLLLGQNYFFVENLLRHINFSSVNKLNRKMAKRIDLAKVMIFRSSVTMMGLCILMILTTEFDLYRPEFQYRESHLRFGWDKGGRGINSWIFSRQDRFWVENHLIRVIEGGKLTDGGNAQGVRVDIYNWLNGANFNYIYSDFSGQANPGTSPDPENPTGTDDAHVFRARREFLGNAVRAGLKR